MQYIQIIRRVCYNYAMSNGNLLSTLQLIRHAGRITRREIAQEFALGFSMISRLTGDLLERGLIREVGRSEAESGRPSDLLALNPTAGYAIGLDISGTRQRAVLVDLCGEVVNTFDENIHILADRENILNTLENLTTRTIQSCGLQPCVIMGVGVGVWGSVDPATGVVYSWTETPALTSTWKDYAVGDALRAHTSFPHVMVDDIVRTMGIAEVLYGHNAGKDEDFVFVLADTGVGVAIMLGGFPYVGPNQLAGEIGHVPIPGVTLPCNCGNTGCLETVASVTGIIRRAEQRLSETAIPSVLRNSQELTIQDLIAAAESGDKLSYQLMTEAGEALGTGLAITVNLLGPKLVVVGGILAESGVYMDAARRGMKLQVLSKASNTVRVEPSQLDEFAGARVGGSPGIKYFIYARRGEYFGIKYEVCLSTPPHLVLLGLLTGVNNKPPRIIEGSLCRRREWDSNSRLAFWNNDIT